MFLCGPSDYVNRWNCLLSTCMKTSTCMCVTSSSAEALLCTQRALVVRQRGHSVHPQNVCVSHLNASFLLCSSHLPEVNWPDVDCCFWYIKLSALNVGNDKQDANKSEVNSFSMYSRSVWSWTLMLKIHMFCNLPCLPSRFTLRPCSVSVTHFNMINCHQNWDQVSRTP